MNTKIPNFKKIAIVSPGYKPVPAVQGGAVETLITYIIDSNENNYQFDIDLYTISDSKLQNINYAHTNIIKINQNRYLNFICKIINFVLRKIKINKVILYFPTQFSKIIKNKQYNKIIIENNMDLYKKIYKQYKYDKHIFYFHMHNNVGEPGNNKKNIKFINDTAKEIIFVSNAVKSAFNKCTNSKRGIVLYNAIDFNKFNFKLIKEEKNIRKKLKMDDKEFNFIFMGRICQDKGIYELIQAFKKLEKKYNNVSLTIVGFGFGNLMNFYEKKILKDIENSKIRPLHFLSSDILIDYIMVSNCVVIPSMYEEAFGVVALEAMAMKKPIISTNAGGLTETLNNDCAIIVDRKNVIENLYNAMEKIYLDEQFAKKIAKNAYDRVNLIKDFNKDNYYNNFLNIITKE